MFEKEAEEYANQSCFTEMQNPSLSESIDISDDIKDAVMFGYNKANEWHYVKDGDYPKDGETVLVYRDDMQIWTGNRHSKRENSYFWYIHNLHGVLYKDSDIYAWKEIVLPKEVEE